MIPDFRVCDRCKTEHVPCELSFFVKTGRSMDAAGSMDDAGENVDLCHACAISALRYLVRDDVKMALRLMVSVRRSPPEK